MLGHSIIHTQTVIKRLDSPKALERGRLLTKVLYTVVSIYLGLFTCKSLAIHYPLFALRIIYVICTADFY